MTVLSVVESCSEVFFNIVYRSSKKASFAEIKLLSSSLGCLPYSEVFGLAYRGTNLQGLNVACWKGVCI